MIKKFIEENYNLIVEDLRNLISMKSVSSKDGSEYPFGIECKKAVDYVMAKAQSWGMKCKNVDDYCCWIEVGTGEEMVGIPVHLDVVPAGDGWSSDPYTLDERDGVLYGRGVNDNKGPAVMLLHALKYLSENERLKRRIRVIFGANEEAGMACIKHYIAAGEEIPALGFTPDAMYPVVIGEKGSIHMTVTQKLKTDSERPYFVMNGGSRCNIVPEKAQCTIYGERINGQQTYITLESQGVSCHACDPAKGKNAITQLLKVVVSDKTLQNVDVIENIYGLTLPCENPDLYVEDDVFGPLTLNVGVINVTKDVCQCDIDIRYPKCISYEKIIGYIKDRLGSHAVLNIKMHKPIHYVDRNSELVEKLMEVYREEFDDESDCLVIGGGTYASCFENMVGFGPKHQGKRTGGHGKDENMSISDFKKNLEVYLKAVIKLAK